MDTTAQLLNVWCKDYEKPDWYQWAIVFGKEVIGSIAVVKFSEDDNSAEISYCIGYDYWGKGIMTESAKAVIDFLFTETGVNRITICHALQNPASGRVAQKCGLTFEGIHKKEFKARWGEYLDMAHYGIVRKDYEKIKNQ